MVKCVSTQLSIEVSPVGHQIKLPLARRLFKQYAIFGFQDSDNTEGIGVEAMEFRRELVEKIYVNLVVFVYFDVLPIIGDDYPHTVDLDIH